MRDSTKSFLRFFGLSYIPPYSLGIASVVSIVVVLPCKVWLEGFIKSAIRSAYNYWFKIYNFTVTNWFKLCKEIVSVVLGFCLSLSYGVSYGAEIISPTQPQLKQYIKIIEKQKRIPSGLLAAIATVESNCRAYAVNISGNPVFANNSKEAIFVIKNAIARGITNIDIGVTQINYRWHKENFTNIEEMLNPKANIEYAGDLLCSLFKKHGNWHKAIRYYHSANAVHYRRYSRKVVMEWLKHG